MIITTESTEPMSSLGRELGLDQSRLTGFGLLSRCCSLGSKTHNDLGRGSTLRRDCSRHSQRLQNSLRPDARRQFTRRTAFPKTAIEPFEICRSKKSHPPGVDLAKFKPRKCRNELPGPCRARRQKEQHRFQFFKRWPVALLELCSKKERSD